MPLKAKTSTKKKSRETNVKKAIRAKSGGNISARKMIEAALLRQNELYRLLADHSSDGVTLIGANGTIEYMSPSHLKILGYVEGEVVGMDMQWIIEQVHPDDRERVLTIQQEDRENLREHSEYKIRVRRKDGSYIWVEDFVQRTFDEQGQLVRVIVNSRNITQRRLTEQALQMAENRYRDLFENAASGIFLSTPEGEYLDVNRAMAQIYGYESPEDMVNCVRDIPNQIYVCSEDRQKFIRLMAEKGSIENFEAQNYRKDGSIIWTRINARIVQQHGNMVYYEGFLTDITERRNANERVQYLAGLLEEVSDAIVSTDIEFIIRSWNRGAERLYGWHAHEVMGKRVGEVIPLQSPPELIQSITDDLLAKGFWQGEVLQPHKDGRLLRIFSAETQLKDGSGQNTGTVAVNRDITERKKMEEALVVSERNYRNLYETIPSMNFTLDSNGMVLSVNRFGLEQLGYAETELIGESILKIFYEDDRADVLTGLRECLLNIDQLYVWEKRKLKKDGSLIWVRESIRATAADDSTVSILVACNDITEQKRIEDALRQSEALKDTVINSMTANIAVINAQGMIISVNRPWEQFALDNGIRNLDGTVKNVNYLTVLRNAIANGDLNSAVVLDGVLNVLSGKSPEFTLEYPCDSPMGIRWYLMKVLPLSLASGGAVISHEDISPRKNDEEKIRRQVEFLTALKDIHSVILSTPDLQSSLKILVSRTLSLLKVDASAILLTEPDQRTLRLGDGLGFRSQNFESSRVGFGDSYAGKAAVERRMVSAPNLKLMPDNPFKNGFLKGEEFVSYYGYPLIVKGEVIGVLEAFHRSPVERDELWYDFFETLASQAAIAIENAHLFEDLKHSNDELELAYDSTIEGWSHALDLRDHETEGHTLRVTGQTLELARRLDIPEEDMLQIRYGALLHDIGKMGVPDTILLKPGPLTEEEWGVMRKHPVFAFELLVPIRYLRKSALEIPYCHHERWDGSGYPRGLKGEEIPFAARMFAVVDVWDALTSDRPYRGAWSEEKALQYLREYAGILFDPRVVDEFIELLKQTPGPN